MVRFKNRYVLCRIRFSDAQHATETTTTTKENLFAACAHQMELQFGRLGATRMRRSTVVKYYDAKYSNVFVVRCARKDVGKMKSSPTWSKDSRQFSATSRSRQRAASTCSSLHFMKKTPKKT